MPEGLRKVTLSRLRHPLQKAEGKEFQNDMENAPFNHSSFTSHLNIVALVILYLFILLFALFGIKLMYV